MPSSNAFAIALATLLFPMSAIAQDRAEEATTSRPPATVSGESVDKEDLKGAHVVRTFTPQEFDAFSSEWTAEQCKKGTLHVRTDGVRMFLDDGDYAKADFGDELARLYKAKPFYCVKIVGPGQDVKLISEFLRHLKGTEMSTINWMPK